MRKRGWLLLVGVGALVLVAWGVSRLVTSGAKSAGKTVLSGAVSSALVSPLAEVSAIAADVKDALTGSDTWEAVAEEAASASGWLSSTYESTAGWFSNKLGSE